MAFGTPVQTLEVAAGSGTSWSAAFASNVTTANTLTCIGGGYSSTASNHVVSDTNNGTGVWSQRQVTNANGSITVSTHYCKNATGGTTPSVTFNAGTGSTGGTAFAQEWDGVDTVTPVVTNEWSSGAGAIAGTHTTGSITNSNADSVYVGAFLNDDSSNPCGTMTWNNSWTRDAQETNGNTHEPGSCGHLLVASSASRQMSVTFTNSGGTASWAEAFIVLQKAAGGPAGPPNAGMEQSTMTTAALLRY